MQALKSLLAEWGHSKVYVWVDRHTGLGSIDKLVKQLQLGKRWKKFVLPVIAHYEPLQHSATQYMPILRTGDDVALVIKHQQNRNIKLSHKIKEQEKTKTSKNTI